MGKKISINEIIQKSRQRVIDAAIEKAARTNTKLIVCVDGKMVRMDPPYKYVRVPTNPSKKTSLSKKPAKISKK